MKYELTEKEKQQINAGEIFTVAAYGPEVCALCEHIAIYNGIKFKAQPSESPTGKKIFVFFFYPTTMYKAFRAGSMLEKAELYTEAVNKLLFNWQVKFPANQISNPA